MDSTAMQAKLKWHTLGDPTKFRLHYPPARAPRKTEHWDNWLRSMMLDTRLNSTDRVVLTTLATHYNLKTGDCFPAMGRVAIEAGLGTAGTRTVQRSIRKAEGLDWIERTLRKGGPREKNQSNLYELRLPESIIGCREIGLRVVKRDGKWFVAQTTDSVVVCGPFKNKENAENWIADHGPEAERHDKQGIATRQNRGGDTAIDPPRTGKLDNREVTEHSVSSIQHSFADASRVPNSFQAIHEDLYGRKKGESEGECASTSRQAPEGRWVGYTEAEVERVRDILLCYDCKTLGSIVACARTFGDNFITGTAIANMCRDGHFGREGDQIFLLGDDAEAAE
jgi:hypothetical protein